MSVCRKGLLILLCIHGICGADSVFSSSSYQFVSTSKSRPSFSEASYKPRRENICPFGWIGKAVKDIVQLNINVFSFDTFRTVGIFSPAYIGSRMIDEDLQRHFFTHDNHKNMNQMPGWCHTAIRFGIGVPIVIFGSQFFLSKDPEWRESGWFLLLGLPFVIFGKDLLKKIEMHACLRPWHEDYCEYHRRACGGFPSGHMAEATYITALYGMRFGPKLAIPLGIYAAALGVIFINCNRHYLSQLIAGAALGTIYAFAANKAIDANLQKDFTCNFNVNDKGASFGCNYRF